VCIPSPSQIAVIDTERNEITASYPVRMAANGHPLAIDETNHRLYVGCRKEPMIVIVDSETGKEIAGVPIPNDVDDLFLDRERKRLFASCGEGFLVVLKQTSADLVEIVERIPTTKG